MDGKQYGIPYDLHVVGFWYRKDLFQQAGISAPPTTVDELNADVAKLKAAGITPISIGSKDRWPDAFWWEYFAVRECSLDVVKSQIQSLKLTDPCWTKAGDDVTAFLKTNPFQTSLPGHAGPAGRGQLGGHGRQRQGGDGAAGRLGGRHHGLADHRQGPEPPRPAGSRSRRWPAAPATRR